MRSLAIAVQLMLGATMGLANDQMHRARRLPPGVVELNLDSEHLHGAAGAMLDARLESGVDAAARMRRQVPAAQAGTGFPCAATVANCVTNGCDQYSTQCQINQCMPGYQWVQGRCLQVPCNQLTGDRWCVDCDRVAQQCTRCVGEFSLAFLRTGVRCGLQADFDDPKITPGTNMATIQPPYKGLNWNATTGSVVAGTWTVWKNTTALSNYNFPQIGTVYSNYTDGVNRVAISTINTKYSSFILVSGTFALTAVPKKDTVADPTPCTKNGIAVTGYNQALTQVCRETVPVPSQSWMLSGPCQGQNLTLVTFEWAARCSIKNLTFSADDIFFIPNPKQ